MTALKREIKKLGIKQITLAKRLGISAAAVSLQAKNGIKMVNSAKKYGSAMGCDPRLLLDL
jgi:predicted transcriptional regulator